MTESLSTHVQSTLNDCYHGYLVDYNNLKRGEGCKGLLRPEEGNTNPLDRILQFVWYSRAYAQVSYVESMTYEKKEILHKRFPNRSRKEYERYKDFLLKQGVVRAKESGYEKSSGQNNYRDNLKVREDKGGDRRSYGPQTNRSVESTAKIQHRETGQDMTYLREHDAYLLKVDLDFETMEEVMTWLRKRFAYLHDIGFFDWSNVRKVEGVHKTNWAVRVMTSKPLDVDFIVIMQLLLGSDYRKEANSLMNYYKLGMRYWNRMFDIKRYPDGSVMEGESRDITQEIGDHIRNKDRYVSES